LPRLATPYERSYYAGIVAERHGKARIRQGGPGAIGAGHDSVRDAMRHYEAAEAVRPPGNDDARLRWNACARLLIRDHAEVEVMEERFEPLLE